MGWAAASSGPLDLFKMSVGEGGIRVPLIIAGPGIEAVDEPNTSFAYVTDLLPTILELTDIDHPTAGGASPLLAPTGRSMAGLLTAQDQNVHEDGTLIAGEMIGGRWISDGNHKAALVAEPYGRGVWELYDLQDDPGETRNIAGDMPDVLDRFIDAWNEYASEVGVLFPPQ
jgi:arylsulfatase